MKVGDVVQLKAGGPKMTIKSVNVVEGQPAAVKTQWFAGVHLMEGEFATDSLVSAEDEK